MKTVLCLLFCLFCTPPIFAQNNSIDKNRKYGITMSAAIFPYKFGIQPGFQIKLGKRFDFVTDYGFTLRGRGNNQYDETHFFKLGTELKYHSGHFVTERYFSLQTGYISRKFQAKDSGWYWKKDSSDASGYGSASIISPVLFAAIKWGREIKVGEKFFLDFFLGIGARYIRTNYNARNVYSIGHFADKRDTIFDLAGYSWEHEGEQVKLHATAGARVGIRF